MHVWQGYRTRRGVTRMGERCLRIVSVKSVGIEVWGRAREKCIKEGCVVYQGHCSVCREQGECECVCSKEGRG